MADEFLIMKMSVYTLESEDEELLKLQKMNAHSFGRIRGMASRCHNVLYMGEGVLLGDSLKPASTCPCDASR